MRTSVLLTTLFALTLGHASAAPCCEKKEKTDKASDESLYVLDATWTDQHAKAFKLSNLKGKPVLITMGYATCKYACPRLAADLLAIEKALTPEELSQLSIVFVSIDPERDTPAQMKKFLEQYKVDQKRWHGLSGEEDAVLELSVALGIRYRKVNETDFAHSNIITLLSPSGEVVIRQEGLGADPKATLDAIRKILTEQAASKIDTPIP